MKLAVVRVATNQGEESKFYQSFELAPKLSLAREVTRILILKFQ